MKGNYISLAVRRQQRISRWKAWPIWPWGAAKAQASSSSTCTARGAAGSRASTILLRRKLQSAEDLVAASEGLPFAPTFRLRRRRGSRGGPSRHILRGPVAKAPRDHRVRFHGRCALLEAGFPRRGWRAFWADWPCSARTGTTGSGQPRVRARVPVLIAHGSREGSFGRRQEKFLPVDPFGRSGLSNSFLRFETGTHGTPIRIG